MSKCITISFEDIAYHDVKGDLKEWIEAMPSLTEEQKETLFNLSKRAVLSVNELLQDALLYGEEKKIE